MDKVALLIPLERQLIFSQSARKRGLALRIIEKDFWVCWTLKRLFSVSEIENQLIFKGGTSLSKAFGLISRFSEDIDVSIKRDYLGFSGENDPENKTSKNQQKKSVEELRKKCCDVVSKHIYLSLKKAIETSLSPAEGSWSLGVDEGDPNTILFSYPSVLDSKDTVLDRYIEPVIRIEFGAGSDNYPIGKHEISPYSAEDLAHLFIEPASRITILEPVRTFWEKVSLLHAEYHRPTENPTPKRISRHYYDIYCLAKSAHRNEFVSDSATLARVIKHKSIFFPSGWSATGSAIRGTLKLLPAPHRVDALAQDYQQMKEMFFQTPPSFKEVLEEISNVERDINNFT